MISTNRMKFELPSEFSKLVAPTTAKIYTAHLNRLAKVGYSTPNILMQNSEAVANYIKSIAPEDDDEARAKRRLYVSAVMWVVPAEYKKTENPYYLLNKSSMPGFFIKKMNI